MTNRNLSKTWVATCKQATAGCDFIGALSILEREMAGFVTPNKAGRLARRFAAVGGMLQDQIRQKRGILIAGSKICAGPTEPISKELAEAAARYKGVAGDFVSKFSAAGRARVEARLQKVGFVASAPVNRDFFMRIFG